MVIHEAVKQRLQLSLPSIYYYFMDAS